MPRSAGKPNTACGLKFDCQNGIGRNGFANFKPQRLQILVAKRHQLVTQCKISQATLKQSARPSFRNETRTPAAFTTNEEKQNAMFDQQRLDAAAHRKGVLIQN